MPTGRPRCQITLSIGQRQGHRCHQIDLLAQGVALQCTGLNRFSLRSTHQDRSLGFHHTADEIPTPVLRRYGRVRPSDVRAGIGPTIPEGGPLKGECVLIHLKGQMLTTELRCGIKGPGVLVNHHL